MIKSRELIGPSCLTNAADDEPIFVLKSTDELAPAIVRLWAGRYRNQKFDQPGGITPKQADKYGEAMELADQMDEWRKSHCSPGTTVVSEQS